MSKTRPRCLILDAGPIIGLHELGAWAAFVDRYEVVVPQLVLSDEALFHSRDADSGFTQQIDLRHDVVAGRVLVASASLVALSRVASRFSEAIELHEGELEALALLTQAEDFAEHVFCSADAAAIEGACMLGLAERCESLEHLLGLAGLGRPVTWRFSKRFTDAHKDEGLKRAVTGFGLRD
ncbi:MAG: hypothetical protein WC709_05530 [Thermoleophilia bacterium]